jgi:NTP pyrophosphatase (non-canonical NTP hydrolase)
VTAGSDFRIIEKNIRGVKTVNAHFPDLIRRRKIWGLTMDDSSTIEQLKVKVKEFRDERNWKKFHDLKNLSIALAVESSELQELFLWKSKSQVRKLLSSEKGEHRVRDELADILIYLLYLSDESGIDLSEAVMEKIGINKRKYPVGKSYNSSKKYNELDSGD